MYDELIRKLRELASIPEHCDNVESCDGCSKEDICLSFTNERIIEVATQAADTIAELSKPKWVKIESRPMDEEERQYYSERLGYDVEYGDAVIYCCQLPEHGQDVLVCDKYGHIWLDTFDDDPDYGVGFETNGDMDGLVAWMPLPEPPKEEESGI